MTRVVVAGALGRMGRVACAAVARADDLALVGGFARVPAPSLGVALGSEPDEVPLEADLDRLLSATLPDVLVDFTVQPASCVVAERAVRHGVSPVIGATGWTAGDESELAQACAARGLGAALVPNFAVGAVLAMRFAAQAARWFPTAEIVELHHDRKRDAPSGTATLTARRIAAGGGPADVPIHSVRLRGLVAHQEALFGGEGELLTIRHDSLSRESFAAGILLAIRGVRALGGLAIGLDVFLEDQR